MVKLNFDVKTHILKNGLEVITIKKNTQISSINIGIKVGALNESLEEKGISHYIEHMIFKGTKNRTFQKLNDELEALGGEYNAFTDYSQTVYSISCLEEELKNAIELLSDMLINSEFPEEEIDKERGVILAEIRSSKDNIEKYTREKNYGSISFIKSKDDIGKLGLSTFFFSDASSAINRRVFEKLNYYDGKRLASNEDQYIAYKLIISGYKIKYCAESEVIHSHDFNFRSLYRRYQDTGDFYRSEPYMNNFGTNSAGFGMAKYILKRIFEEKNWRAGLEFIPNMAARFLGMKIKK